MRNKQVSWVVLRPFGAGGRELSVVPFCLSVGWASVAPNCKRTGSSLADGYVRPNPDNDLDYAAFEAKRKLKMKSGEAALATA